MSDSEDIDDSGTAYLAALGKFGAHVNVEKRARAERLAAMSPTDNRRRRAGAARDHQFNTRITKPAFTLAQTLMAAYAERDGRKWSQADLVEHLLETAAKKLPKSKGGDHA